jgi:hypothetical protein
MELNKIEKLLARYEEGETSLSEEKILREYFQKHEVPEHLKSYQMIFRFSAAEAEERPERAPMQPEKNNWYGWVSVAAILVVALGLFFYNDSAGSINEGDLGTISDEELALQKTKETLNMVSQIMNEGKSELIYLKEFNKTTNKIIQID